MSYILDALKKSDRERQRHHATSLVAPHAEFRAGRGAGASAAAWLMAGSLAVASGVGGALLAMGWREDPQTLATVASQPGAGAVVAQDAQPVADETAVPAAAAPEAASEDISAPALALMELWQLGEAEQRYLGALEVSFHVHSSDPAQRTVIVNGLRAKEGQSLGQDIRLLEITADGLIVEFQGKHVHLATVNAS